MKGAGKFADELKSLVRKFAKEGKKPALEKMDPLRALTWAIFAFDTTDANAEAALKVVDRDFVDINELRVATELEVHDLIGDKFPQIARRAALLNASYNGMFDREGVLSFIRIGTLKKAEIRQFVRDLPLMSPFVEAYACLMAFDINAMPMDDMNLAFLKHAGAIDQAATIEEAQKFVEGHLKPDETYELFCGLRRAAKESFVPPPAPVVEDAKKKKK